MKKDRETIQYEAIKAWAEKRVGTIILPTGVGKSYVGATIAVKQLLSGKIEAALIVVPTTVLVEQWRNEIIKWYGEDILQFINIGCIQTLHKNPGYADLIIIDEVHTALSPIYSKIFTNITHKQILGLTATIPHREDHKEILDKYCPVVFTYSMEDASKEDIIASCVTYNLEIPLNKKDAAKYRTFNNQFNRAVLELSVLKQAIPTLKHKNVFDIAKEFNKATNPGLKELIKWSKSYWASMTLRKWVCYEAQTKIDYILEIIRKFPNKKWIIFNKSIKFAEELHKRIPNSGLYHSKMKNNERKDIITKFADNTITILVAVDALNAGLNIPDADAAICASGVSTELINTQQQGRIRRKGENKIALFINLYCKDTVEKGWVTTKTKGTNSLWITNIKHIQ